MNKKLLLAVLLVGLAFSFGCTGGNKTAGSPFLGGTNGILINFADNAPPDQIYDDNSNPFDVVVRLTNDGEYTVAKNKITVSLIGVDPVMFGQTPSAFFKMPSDDLIATTKDSSGNKQPSTPLDIEFNAFNYVGKVVGDMTYNIIAKVCYNYETTATAKMCINNNLMDTRSTVCKLTEAKTIFSSGAPIQITSLKQSVAGKDRISLEFAIEQKGNGNIFKRDFACTDIFANRDKVYVTVTTNMPGLRCTGLTGGDERSGFITLYEGKRTITCVQAIDTLTQQSFEKPITITANYDYLEMKTEPIIIKKSI
jgi:hypothetical protein